MNNIVNAFVRITPQTHAQISSQLTEYESHFDYNNQNDSYALVSNTKEGRGSWSTSNSVEGLDGAEWIDCNHYANGDEELAIWLFLELAKMRENHDFPKYIKFKQDVYRYPDGGSSILEYSENEICEWEDLFNCEPICYYWEKATSLEIAEAVHQGRIIKT